MQCWYGKSLWAAGGKFSQVSDPRARCTGPTRGPTESNSRVMLTQPVNNLFLAVHHLT